MRLFRRKDPPEPESPPCNHKWQDFPWIIKGQYDPSARDARITVVEPYVCIYCKERRDKKLSEKWYYNVSRKDFADIMDTFCEAYKDYAEPEAVVEDKIADFQLVDREWLELANILRRSRQ